MNMKFTLRSYPLALCMTLFLAQPQQAAAQEIDFGTAGRYSAFILGDMGSGTKVGGRLAVANNLNVSSLTIGAALPGDAGTGPSLVVGQNIQSYGYGEIRTSGGMKGYGTYAGLKSNTAYSLDLRKLPSAVDFASESIWLTMLSAKLVEGIANGAVVQQSTSIKLRGTGSDVEVFNLSYDQLAADKTLSLENIKSGAYLILNVSSNTQKQVVLGLKQSVLQNRQQRVLFNFHDADVVRIHDYAQIWGSILAPHACVKGLSGKINGNVVAASWQSKTEIGYAPFEPRQ